MLQFLKKGNKHGHQKYINNSQSQGSNLFSDQNSCTSNPCYGKKSPLPLPLDDEGLFDIGELDSSKDHSRLTRTLSDIVSDKNALGYFLQYMESRNATPYILCWLDIEDFKSVSNPKVSNPTHSQNDHDSLSVSTDCDSYNSLCDYSSATLSEEKNPSDETCDKEQSVVEKALDIFKKYIALEAQCNIKCTEDVRKEVMENICKVSPNSFEAVQNFVYNAIHEEYFNAFLDSDYFCKYQIDLLTSGNIVLDDILYNETALFYFMEYLEQEDHRNLLEFWMAASNFQQQLQDQKEFFDPIEAQTDAVVLYDKYFSLQAICPLGFSDKIRLAVEQSICGEDGLTLDCFHLPLKIVERVLEKNYLKTFLASQLFYKYLSDLINTNSYANIERCKTAPSDCSSERSFSQSTFLAFEVPHDAKKVGMTIDTREMYDPDALWKRKKFHRLSLGRVNELGRYETEFEPEPDKKQFKFKNVLKRVISLDDDNAKREEMAWQVAELIVKDITDVTLGRQNK